MTRSDPSPSPSTSRDASLAVYLATGTKRAYTRTRSGVRPYQRVAATLMAAAVASLVPTRFDPALTRTVSRLHLAIAPRRKRWLVERIEQHLGPDTTSDVARAADAYWLQRVETRWGQARGISTRGWHPEVELTGLDHLADARDRGKGTILWRVSGHSAIPLNQALAAAGYPAVHLSSTNHLLLRGDPFFQRRIAPLVGPVLRRGEDAPLRERVAFDNTTVRSATRRLVEVLGANGLVTIVGDLSRGLGRHNVQINCDEVALANGGAKLSLATGAALLPVTITRTAPSGYRVDVLPPLERREGTRQADERPARGRTERDRAVASLIEQFADVVADVIRRDPSQWPRWRGPTS